MAATRWGCRPHRKGEAQLDRVVAMRVAMAIGPLGYAGLVLAAAGSQLQPPERSAVQVTSVPIITVGGLLLLGDLYVRNR